MRKIVVTIASMIISLYGYCQDYYAWFISNKALPVDLNNSRCSVDINNKNILILHVSDNNYILKDVSDLEYDKAYQEGRTVLIKSHNDSIKVEFTQPAGRKYYHVYASLLAAITKRAEKKILSIYKRNQKQNTHSSHFSASHVSHTSHYSSIK